MTKNYCLQVLNIISCGSFFDIVVGIRLTHDREPNRMNFCVRLNSVKIEIFDTGAENLDRAEGKERLDLPHQPGLK